MLFNSLSLIEITDKTAITYYSVLGNRYIVLDIVLIGISTAPLRLHINIIYFFFNNIEFSRTLEQLLPQAGRTSSHSFINKLVKFMRYLSVHIEFGGDISLVSQDSISVDVLLVHICEK